MAPFRHTVSFIHREKRHLQTPEPLLKVFAVETLGSDVKQLYPALLRGIKTRGHFAARKGGVQECGRQAHPIQRVDLILHQRDQGRDHNSDPRHQHGWYLIA